MYMKHNDKKNFLKKHKNIVNIPFNFTNFGSQIILNQLKRNIDEN